MYGCSCGEAPLGLILEGDAVGGSPEDNGVKDPGPPYCPPVPGSFEEDFFAGGRSC